MNISIRHLIGSKTPFLMVALSLFIAVSLDAGDAPSSRTGANTQKEKKEVLLYKERQSEWKDVTIQVYSTGKDGQERVNGKSAYYHIRHSDAREVAAMKKGYGFELIVRVPVTVFVTKSGRVWAGAEQQFYIETDSRIFGGKMWVMYLLWNESLLAKGPNEITDVYKALRRFDLEDNALELENTYDNTRGPDENRVNRLMCMSDYLSSFFVGDTSHIGLFPWAKAFRGVHVSGTAVRLDFQGVASKGSVWVDIESRKVLRSVENGKQVFPK